MQVLGSSTLGSEQTCVQAHSQVDGFTSDSPGAQSGHSHIQVLGSKTLGSEQTCMQAHSQVDRFTNDCPGWHSGH